MTLRLRIFLFNLISVFLATFVVALIGLKIVESTVIDSTYERLTQIRISKTTAIENYFRDLQTAINLISSHEQTDDLMLDTNMESHPEFRRLLDNYVLDFNIYDMALVNPKGVVVYTTRKDIEDGISILRDTHGTNKLKDLFQWGMKAQEGSTLFLDFDKDAVSPSSATGFVAAPIFRRNMVVGVLILKISISEIDRITSDNFAWATHGMGQTGETLIYGEDWSLRNTGRFRVEGGQSSKSSEAEILSSNRGDEDIKKIENLSEVRELGTDYRGQKVIRSIGKIYLPNGELWYIQTKIDESEAFAVLDRIAIASSAAAVLIFILFFFATFAATGKVVEPIQLLTDRLEKLGTSNLTQKINYNSKDEIGLLVSKYNQLADRLETTTVSKEFLDSVIQSIKAFLFIVRVTHHDDWRQSSYVVSQANESAMNLLGITPSQLSHIDLKTLVHAQPEFSNYNWLLHTRHSIEAEIVNAEDRRIPILMNWAALPGRTGKDLTFVFVCTDITDRITAENALIEAREAAVKASQAKSEFLARMSHEIRTPLNAIIGITDILTESDLKPEQEQLVRVCANAGENLLALINDILDISKIEAREVRLEKIAFDLQATTNNICDILKQKAAEKNLRFNLEMHLDSATSRLVVGDPTRLRQILFNLIGNAIKFTQQGQITVTADFEDETKKYVRFGIKDTGTGIPLDKQHLLFQNFVQADSSITRKFGGSGLGLTISKNLVELMGGRIWFESEEGAGSAFFFTIPFIPAEPGVEAAPAALAAPTPPPPEEKDLTRNSRILVVDDTEDNRFLLLTYLKKLPFEVVQAENGLQAVEKVFSEPFDLILMDIQMPVMDGYAATRKIRQWEAETHRKPIPIIAVSANAMAEDVQKSLDAGCSEHVTKPIKKSYLIDMIQRYTV
ncbi:hybrid sensor histidine kinase/response regulator [Bdellovibrio bacteriovorus]|uniref:Sensory/regulatory protein RpfC n=1 Tax=Bdellovibrio bacteriovorus TaxID=959 RepID=A0A162H1B5_BDEBC|nr:ATP-binding protein [Bdellovibrio bacteriovorus]KYG69425.1 hybrid sensor histidine kinase/response regulator [Bdellovibrio bacteriovorus]